MNTLIDIPVRRTSRSRLHESDLDHLEFGKYVADHMLIADYRSGEWQRPQIVPYNNLSLSPATLALHYGQTVFEGMKAFRAKNGRINIFRMERHYERFCRSLDRMCMPHVPREVFTEGLLRLIEVDAEWVPNGEGESLYIRPFVFASESRFGVKVSEEYRFVVFTGPVPALYTNPIKVKVETHYIRAARGGTGAAKCGGNYGAAFLPTMHARQEGYDQVLWTDGGEDPHIEESGMMNVMFVINNRLVTPPLSDSILDGVTRDSLITIANDMGIEVEERPVSVKELETSARLNHLTEAFGAGTAAVVAPVKVISVSGTDYHIPPYTEKSIMFRLKTDLENIRHGLADDRYGWNTLL